LAFEPYVCCMCQKNFKEQIWENFTSHLKKVAGCRENLVGPIQSLRAPVIPHFPTGDT
jgi:hypothetical protein